MPSPSKRVVRILALGSAPQDDQIRVTTGNQYSCWLGDDSQHQALHRFCEELLGLLQSLDMRLEDFSPQELTELLEALLPDPAAQ